MAQYTIDTTTIDSGLATYGNALRRINGRREGVNADEQRYGLGLACYVAAFAESKGCPFGARGKSPKGLAEVKDETVRLAGFEKFGGSIKRGWDLGQALRQNEETREHVADPEAMLKWLAEQGIEIYTAAKAAYMETETKSEAQRLADIFASMGMRTKEECAEYIVKNAEFGKALRKLVAEQDAKAEKAQAKAEAMKAETQAKADARKAERALAKAVKAMEAAGLDASAIKAA